MTESWLGASRCYMQREGKVRQFVYVTLDGNYCFPRNSVPGTQSQVQFRKEPLFEGRE
jgi:hypothetical protein